MDTTIFFARLLGFYFLAAAIFLFLRKNEFPSIIREMERTPFHLIVSGFMAILFGLVILLLHPVWAFDLRALVTLIGVWSVIIGIIRLFFPTVAIGWGKKMSSSRQGMNIMAAVMGVISLSLLYLGFVR